MLECMLCAVYEGHFTHRIIPPLSYFLFKLSILSNYLLNNIVFTLYCTNMPINSPVLLIDICLQ